MLGGSQILLFMIMGRGKHKIKKSQTVVRKDQMDLAEISEYRVYFVLFWSRAMLKLSL